MAKTSGIKLLKTPYHAPQANAICERFMRSVRQECLDHLLIFQEKQLQRVLNAYVLYFNQARPHQGIRQQIPEPSRSALSSYHAGEKVIAHPVMGGLPTLKSAYAPDRESRYISLDVLAAEGEVGIGWPGHPAVTEIQRHIADAVNMVLSGEREPKEALDDAAEEVNELLSEY